MEVIRQLRKTRMVDASWSMSRVIQMALEEWLDELESQEDIFENASGYKIIKPAGMPYPERETDALRKGKARKGERKDIGDRKDGNWTTTTTRLPLPLYERFFNMVYWRDTLRSHEIERALIAWFEKNIPNKAL